jgi:hypothetical protein
VESVPSEKCKSFADHQWIGGKAKQCKSCKTKKFILYCKKCGLKYVVKEEKWRKMRNA